MTSWEKMYQELDLSCVTFLTVLSGHRTFFKHHLDHLSLSKSTDCRYVMLAFVVRTVYGETGQLLR